MASRVATKTTLRILQKARDALKGEGWTWGALYRDGAYCSVGAINYAVTGDPNDPDGTKAAKAIQALAEFGVPKAVLKQHKDDHAAWYDDEDLPPFEDFQGVVIGFNDDQEKPRPVLDAFSRAIKRVQQAIEEQEAAKAAKAA